jgi:lipoprotein-anchoring transpeptidase ErfK/SrfK
MASGVGAVGLSRAIKLLFVAGFAAIVFLATDLPARKGTPSPAPVAEPARQPRPASPAAVIPAAKSPEDSFVVKRILNIDGPLAHGAWVWDDEGVPAGPIIITVDLAAQTLSVFRDGYEIGVAVILYGADDKQTPLGVFPITQKRADHVSNLYNAPMPYMLRLTNDGVAIHGSEVAWGAATHGCIGVPVKFAARLFDQAKLGDRVIITNGKRLGLGEPI